MDTKKRQKLIRTLTDALYELFAAEAPEKPTTKYCAVRAKSTPKAVETKEARKPARGPKKGSKAPKKPCPVTGTLNTHRRFSYLMPEVRTPENLAKFKGGGKAKAA